VTVRRDIVTEDDSAKRQADVAIVVRQPAPRAVRFSIPAIKLTSVMPANIPYAMTSQYAR
jgi:hypothetical protein